MPGLNDAAGENSLFLSGVPKLLLLGSDNIHYVKGRWIDKLAGVDVYGESHIRTMLIYVRWDDKL